MFQCYFPVSRTNVSPGTTGSFQDADTSAIVASGASGVALHLTNAGASDRQVGWRKNGSTDNRTANLRSGSQCFAYVGVDSSRICEMFIAHADVVVDVVGYFGADVVFLTNAVDKSPAIKGSFQDADISSDTGADTAVLGMFEYLADGNRPAGFRMKGSGDGRAANFERGGVIVGVNGSEVCEINLSGIGINQAFLIGYVKDSGSVTVNTNGVNRSLGSTGTYVDLAALPANTVACVYEINTGGAAQTFSLRQKGASDDHFLCANGRHDWHLIPPDGSLLTEGKISDIDVDYYEIAYFTTPQASNTQRLSLLGVGV